MLTLFTTTKPFTGYVGMIQRNALKSWLEMDVEIELLLFGDAPGTEEVANQVGARHFPNVPTSPHSPAPYMDSMFDMAQAYARFGRLAFVNADIILPGSIRSTLSRVPWKNSLLIGGRWDLDVTAPVDFSDEDWAGDLVRRARTEGKWSPGAVDYFIFPKGFFLELPRFVIGRTSHDNYLIYHGVTRGDAVVDISEVFPAIHQNHDYAHSPEGKPNDFRGKESNYNVEILKKYMPIGKLVYRWDDATHILTSSELKPNPDHTIREESRERLSRGSADLQNELLKTKGPESGPASVGGDAAPDAHRLPDAAPTRGTGPSWPGVPTSSLMGSL